jgi:GNAT superfamily N-acetyltransferase
MPSMTIRDLEPEQDAAALTALAREVDPTSVLNEASWLHRARTLPPRARARSWVVDLDGVAVARVVTMLHIFGGTTAHILLAVREDVRRQGIGSALYDLGLEYARSLAPSGLATDFFESPAGVAFARAHGFREARAEQISVVDPRAVSEAPRAEVRSLVHADLRDAHRIDEAATRDMPALEPVESIPYDEWEQHVLEHPLFTREGSFVAYADGEAAAVSLLIADPESGRAAHMFTGTLPGWRGRGLGTSVKLASIHWAAANGITQIATSNDETNAPMLAINRRLGYRPAGRRVEWVKGV